MTETYTPNYSAAIGNMNTVPLETRCKIVAEGEERARLADMNGYQKQTRFSRKFFERYHLPEQEIDWIQSAFDNRMPQDGDSLAEYYFTRRDSGVTGFEITLILNSNHAELVTSYKTNGMTHYELAFLGEER